MKKYYPLLLLSFLLPAGCSLLGNDEPAINEQQGYRQSMPGPDDSRSKQVKNRNNDKTYIHGKSFYQLMNQQLSSKTANGDEIERLYFLNKSTKKQGRKIKKTQTRDVKK
jgi:hypothetical protein